MSTPKVTDTTGKVPYSLANDSKRSVKNVKSADRKFTTVGEEKN